MNLSRKIHLREGERIVSVIRPYSLPYFWEYGLGLAFLFVSSFFMFRFFAWGWYGYALYGAGMLIGLYMIFKAWFLNNSNILVITGERVVDISRLGIFNLEVSSTSYLDLKDVAIRKKGIFPNLFNYGTVIFQTRSQQFVIEFPKAHNPQKIQAQISELSQSFRQNRKVADVRAIYQNFIKIIPDLPDAELHYIKKMIDEQLGPAGKEKMEMV